MGVVEPDDLVHVMFKLTDELFKMQVDGVLCAKRDAEDDMACGLEGDNRGLGDGCADQCLGGAGLLIGVEDKFAFCWIWL